LLLADYHVHTLYSADSREKPEAYLQYAARAGLDEICFTEHADFHPYDRGSGTFDHGAYAAHLARLETHRNPGPTVTKGIEIGYNRCYENVAADFLRDKTFDFIMGSVHMTEDENVSEDEKSRSFFTARSAKEAYRAYFDEVEGAVLSGLFHVIGHFDLVKRFGTKYYGPFDLALCRDQVAHILELQVSRGVGLEVNTSGYRQPPAEPYPGLPILSLFRDLGGEVVTLGSDAHRAEHAGWEFGRAAALVREAGLRGIARFRGGRPVITDF